MFDGVKFKLGGEEFVIPALSLGQLRNGAMAKIKERDDMVTKGQVFEAFPIMGEIIGQAIRRNYPDVTDERLMEVLDAGNVNQIYLAVLGVSNLLRSGGEVAATDPTISGQSTVS